MPQPNLVVFAFSAAFGLPSSGPFAVKLITWLRLVGLTHTVRYEDNTMKGPKGKNPWIEIDGAPMGDTELIIEHLSERCGVSLEGGLTPEQVGRGVAIRRMVEEHLHQVFEHELIVQDAGYAVFYEQIVTPIARATAGGLLGPLLAPLAGGYLRRHFRAQLKARGVGRHSVEQITKVGITDLEALEGLLGDRSWFVADHPTLTDCSVYGLVAPFVLSDLPTPVCTWARGRERLVRWVRSMKARLEDTAQPEPLRLVV